MKTWWNILIWMWIVVIHRAEHVNGDFLLTSSPLIPTDGDLFTLTCRIRNESTVNIGWLQNNKPEVVTQQNPNCRKQQLAYGQDIINRINVSCSTTAHSMTFNFSSTTDQGTAWQCGNQVSDYDIHPRSNNYTIGSVMSTQSLSTTTRSMAISSDPETVTPTKGVFLLTSSPLIPTDGDLFTLTCSIRDESTINIGWFQNNKPKVVTQKTPNCLKQALAYGHDIINRINVSCSTTAHSMTFRFSSTTDQGAAWQCGNQVSDYDIHPRSNNYTIDVAGSVMSTQSLSTTTRSMAMSSDPETVTPTKVVTRPVTSTQSTSTTTRYMETTSDPETVTPKKDVTRPVMSTQSTSTTTRYMETTSDPETVTPKKGPKNPQPLNAECNVTGAVAGSTIGTLLLTLLIEGLVLMVLYRKGFRFGNVLKGTSSLTSTRNPEIEEMDNEGYSSLDQISGPAQDSSIDKEGSEKQHHAPLKIYENTNAEAEAETSTYDNLTEMPPVSYESIRASPYQNSGPR